MAQARLLAKACRPAPNRGRTAHDPHSGCISIYLKGPDGEQLEVTYQTRPLGAEELDAETFRALGISAEERAAMTR